MVAQENEKTDVGTIEMEWSWFLHGNHPTEEALPVPLKAVTINDVEWRGGVPVTYKRADQVTEDDKQAVAAILKELAEYYKAKALGAEALIRELEQ